MRRPLRAGLLDSVLEVHAPVEVAEPLAQLLPPSAAQTETVRLAVDGRAGRYVVHGPGREVDCLGVPHAVDRVLELCNATAVEACRDFAVHAGVVHRDGRTVALPAASGVGKSTLVASLLRTGWSYVSDEALVVTDTGTVRPYPKWLSLHRWTLDRLGLPPPADGRDERPAEVAELGGAVPAQHRLRLTDVVLPTRTTGASRLARRGAAAGAVGLLQMSFNHYRDPHASVEVVSQLARACDVWSLEMGDPLEAAALLTSAVAPA